MIGAVFLVFVILFCVGGAVGSVYLIVQKANIPKVLAKPCCPPGLGCNDPDGSRQHCYRALALRMASVSEGTQLDNTWSNFQGASWYYKKGAQARFANTRDGIIQQHLAQVGIDEHDSRQLTSGDQNVEFPTHHEVMNSLVSRSDFKQPLRGEVL